LIVAGAVLERVAMIETAKIETAMIETA